jgi:TPR repeat protein
MARRLYELAAQQGYVAAMPCLGAMYYEGQGVEQSYERAKEYYEQAADLEHAKAQQYNLSVSCTQMAMGVEKDLKKSKVLWTEAAARGDQIAIKGLNILNKQFIKKNI